LNNILTTAMLGCWVGGIPETCLTVTGSFTYSDRWLLTIS